MICRFQRTFEHCPGVPAPPVGRLVCAADLASPAVVWIEIRNRVFATGQNRELAWPVERYARELTEQPWWSVDRLWFAVADDGPPELDQAVGTVALAERGRGPERVALIHWLAVLPEWRGQGIGDSLLAAAEAHAWALGLRRIEAETLAAWEAAVRLYERRGYRAIVK